MVYNDVSFFQDARPGVKRFVIGFTAFLAVAGSAWREPAAAAPALTVLHSFTGYPDGIDPLGRLAMDSSGALYGTTYAGGTTGGGWGTVFKLTPPAAGKTQWTKTLLYAFTAGADGSHPRGGVIVDSKGALYGTTADGGLAGKVFKLTPPVPPATKWTYTVLYSFGSGSDGNTPLAGLIMDSTGALYGTTAYGGGYGYYGAVFKLTPPAAPKTQWSETVLHSFPSASTSDGFGPYAGLAFDSKGTLYGTTYFGGTSGSGTVFKLTPPSPGKTAWTETILYSFKGGTDGYNLVADLSIDSKGTLYGTTPAHPINGQCGVVFRLTPPALNQTQWTKDVLYNFDSGIKGCDPEANVILDSNGALYGTTKGGSSPLNGGTIFKLAPPAAGKTAWTETVLYGFKNGTDGYGPVSDLIFDKNGALYGTTYFGSSVGGAVFKFQ